MTAWTARSAAREIRRYGEQMSRLLESLTEEQIWAPGPGGANAMGTLAYHLGQADYARRTAPAAGSAP